jgi:hypothetical protein
MEDMLILLIRAESLCRNSLLIWKTCCLAEDAAKTSLVSLWTQFGVFATVFAN